MKNISNFHVGTFSVLCLGAFSFVLSGQSGCEFDVDGDGWTTSDGDCDDADSNSYPGATEVCDAADNDCENDVDEDNPCSTCYTGTLLTQTYQICASPKSWTDALAQCESFGYTLMSIGSGTEDNFLMDLAETYGMGSLWVGFNDIDAEGTWEWYSGEDVAYTNWSSGEPNNYGDGEDCCVANWNGNSWNDGYCSSSEYFICETW